MAKFGTVGPFWAQSYIRNETVVLFDSKLCMRFINTATEKSADAPAENLIGKTVDPMLKRRRRSRFAETLRSKSQLARSRMLPLGSGGRLNGEQPIINDTVAGTSNVRAADGRGVIRS